MSNEPTTPPPTYGTVTSQPFGAVTMTSQPYGAVTAQPGVTPFPSTPPPDYEFPQPGLAPPAATYPQEPPPMYEPPKDGQYPPGTYPPQEGYHHPQPAYPQGYDPASQGYQTQTVYLGGFRWSPLPQNVQCPSCHGTSVSTIQYKPGALTWLAGGLLCLFGCWLGCCLIPFCMPDLQDVEHRCSVCGKYMGTHMRM